MSTLAYERTEVHAGHKPWRCSYDVEDPRAKVFRPIGDGTVPGALDFVDAYVRTLGEYADFTKQAGRSHAITANAIKLVERILRRCTDFKTGRCEPSLDKIMAVTGFARPTVVSLLAKCRKLGLIDWVRRTETTANAAEGPRRRQVTNAYFFELTRLPTEALRRLRQLLRKKSILAREWPERKGSGAVPSKAQRFASKVVKAAASAFRSGAGSVDAEWRDKAASLIGRSPADQAALLYPGDPASQREHLLMLTQESASSERSPVHPSRSKDTS